MLFNIISNDGETEYNKENPTYDEIIKFINEKIGCFNPMLSYLDNDGKQYYVNCQNDINEVKRKLSNIKKVNLYINIQTWTCNLCTYDENQSIKCDVCGNQKQ